MIHKSICVPLVFLECEQSYVDIMATDDPTKIKSIGKRMEKEAEETKMVEWLQERAGPVMLDGNIAKVNI